MEKKLSDLNGITNLMRENKMPIGAKTISQIPLISFGNGVLAKGGKIGKQIGDILTDEAIKFGAKRSIKETKEKILTNTESKGTHNYQILKTLLQPKIHFIQDGEILTTTQKEDIDKNNNAFFFWKTTLPYDYELENIKLENGTIIIDTHIQSKKFADIVNSGGKNRLEKIEKEMIIDFINFLKIIKNQGDVIIGTSHLGSQLQKILDNYCNKNYLENIKVSYDISTLPQSFKDMLKLFSKERYKNVFGKAIISPDKNLETIFIQTKDIEIINEALKNYSKTK